MFLSFFYREVHDQGRDYGQIVICYVLQPPRLPRLSKWMLRIVSRDYGHRVDTIVKGGPYTFESFSSNYQMIFMVKLFEQQNMLSNDDGVTEQRISL